MMFSVIIPVFNRPVPVRNAVQSVINQNYENWECIVVDDASTDSTFSVCQELSYCDSRVKAIRLENNGGVSAARNAGLAKAEGDWIIFLDSDDELVPDAMSILSRVIGQTDVEIVTFATSQEWSPSEEICCKVLNRDFIRSTILPQHINIMPQTNDFLRPYVANKCIKRALIEKNNIRFDEWRRTWEDNVFLVKCLDLCNSIYVIPDKLYLIGDYQGTSHLSRLVDSDLFLNYIDSYYRYRDHFGSEFNFDNDYTARRYFGVIHEQLIIFFDKSDETEFKELLSKLIHDEAMNSWINRIQGQNEIENRIKKAFMNHDENALYQIYEESAKMNKHKTPKISIIKRVINGLKRRLKEQIG